MQHLGSSFRQTITLTLILIGLFHAPAGPAFAWLQSGSLDRSYVAPTVKPGTYGYHTPLSVADQQTKARASEAYGKLPMRFEANAGQTDAQVKFISRDKGYNLFLTPTEAVLALRNEGAVSDTDQRSVVRMKFTGANPAPSVEGVDALPGKSNYFIGNDPSRWCRNVTSYRQVRYSSVYPGIDLLYYGNQQQLEYDFVVSPGADPNVIKLSFDGVDRMEVNAQGDLVLHTEGGELRQRKPVTYQEMNGRRREIASRYVLRGGRQVGFELAAYDPALPLVIDPVLVYSTYLGGTGMDVAQDVAVDAAGNAYLIGYTFSADFPTADPLQPAPGGTLTPDVFVTKLNVNGSALVYSTYLGGNNTELGFDIAVDQEGNAYLTGSTGSVDFPTMNPLQPALSGSQDAFVTKLNPAGSALILSTYLGGGLTDQANALAIDRQRNVYLTGYTLSSDFPTMNPLQPALSNSQDAFVTKLNSAGSALVFSTFLGGSDGDNGNDIAVDRRGNVYLVGATNSIDFPTANPLQPELADSGPARLGDAFVTKLDASGTAFIYSTYFGGNNRDTGNSVAVDALDNVYVTGSTGSINFPTMNPLQPSLAGGNDAFVAKLDQSGSALHYSTYLGGSTLDIGAGIAVDARGNAFVTGFTNSNDFPTLNPVQPTPGTPFSNAFVSNLQADGSGFVYSTYLGGNFADSGAGIAVDVRGNAYVVGSTNSADFPTTPEAFQRELRGPIQDAFITKLGNLGYQ
jgi:Beta-propeller repeat